MVNKKGAHLTQGEKNVRTRQPSGNIRRNIDYGPDLHLRLESISEELNISSQALVKLALQEWIDRYTIARYYDKNLKTGT